MALRATGQNAEVLAAGDGKLRVTRQVADVLVSGTGKLRVTSQVVEVLVDEATGGTATESVSQSLAFSQAAAASASRPGQASNTLDLSDQATAEAGHLVSDDLALSDAATASIDKARNATDSLTLAQCVEIRGPVYVEIHHVLDLQQSDDGHAGVLNLRVEDVLTLEDRASRAVPVSVSQAIAFTQSGNNPKTGIAQQTLTLAQTVTAGKSKGVLDRLGLTQTVTTTGTFNRPVAQALGLQQACTCWIDGPRRFDRQYYPFVGDGANSPTPPSLSLNAPLEGITAPFQLVFPAAGDVTDSCTLRAPNLGNRDRLSFNRINRETRGGTLVVYADPIWPKTQALVLSFSGLRRSEALDLLAFLSDHLGQEIGLLDWESRYWRGIVTTTSDPVVEDSHDSFSANFEFEGELDPSWSPQIIPVGPGTPRRRVKPEYRETPDPMEPIPPVTPMTESYSAEADAAIAIGQPVYLKTSGHADLAQADAAGRAGAIGFAITAAEASFAVDYVTEGKLTLADWTAIAGTAALVAGANYFLDAASRGRITGAAPTAAGQYVVRLGRAASALTLDIEIEAPIRL